jgi:hypothetical protein
MHLASFGMTTGKFNSKRTGPVCPLRSTSVAGDFCEAEQRFLLLFLEKEEHHSIIRTKYIQ